MIGSTYVSNNIRSLLLNAAVHNKLVVALTNITVSLAEQNINKDCTERRCDTPVMPEKRSLVIKHISNNAFVRKQLIEDGFMNTLSEWAERKDNTEKLNETIAQAIMIFSMDPGVRNDLVKKGVVEILCKLKEKITPVGREWVALAIVNMSKDSEQIHRLIEHRFSKIIRDWFGCQNDTPDMRENISLALANISGDPNSIQRLIIWGVVISMSEWDQERNTEKVNENIAKVIMNISCSQNEDYIRYLVDNGVVKTLCELKENITPEGREWVALTMANFMAKLRRWSSPKHNSKKLNETIAQAIMIFSMDPGVRNDLVKKGVVEILCKLKEKITPQGIDYVLTIFENIAHCSEVKESLIEDGFMNTLSEWAERKNNTKKLNETIAKAIMIFSMDPGVRNDLVHNGVVETLSKLIKNITPVGREWIALAIVNMSEDSEQIHGLIEPSFREIIGDWFGCQNDTPDMRENISLALANISGDPNSIQIFIRWGVVISMSEWDQEGNTDKVNENIARVIMNILRSQNKSYIRYLVENGVVKTLCELKENITPVGRECVTLAIEKIVGHSIVMWELINAGFLTTLSGWAMNEGNSEDMRENALDIIFRIVHYLIEDELKKQPKINLEKILKVTGLEIGTLIKHRLSGFNNIKLEFQRQGHSGKIGEFIMIHTMKEMITQRNDSEAPTVHDLSATEKQIIKGIMNNTDGVHLYHTGYIGHATCTLRMTGETKYLIHTNRGSGAITNNGKAPPMVICSKDDSKINDVKNKLLRFLQTENSMDQPKQILKSFPSDGGNQQFIKAVESIAAKPQTMGNCWIKSYNQALKIRLFIGFLKAKGFKFDENPGDDDKIKEALKDAKTLFRKILLARVNVSISLLDGKVSSDETKLLEALEFKKNHILEKLI